MSVHPHARSKEPIVFGTGNIINKDVIIVEFLPKLFPYFTGNANIILEPRIENWLGIVNKMRLIL